MLRIFVFEEPFSVKLRLEGQLTSQTVPILTQKWAEVHSRLKDRKAILDLGDLVEFDESGRSTLRWLAQSGARFGYAHPKVQQLAQELALEGPSLLASMLRLSKSVRVAVAQSLARLRESPLYQRMCALLPITVRPCGCRAA
jgi:ABC-type transporter Mla MlaB component